MDHYHKGFDFDLGSSIDDIIHAAREFGERMRETGPDFGPFGFDPCARGAGRDRFNFYPPANMYVSREGSMVLEFALAGFDEDSLSISFQGDDLLLSAKALPRDEETDTMRYCRHGFRPRDIDRQRYRVAADDFAQDLAKAVFKNGVLTVTIPAKEPEGEAVRIQILKEGN
jgi:HSP20 family protein